ncbi:hypothetical protein CEE36_00625 [candidate division TA06 bacterium B3_TA06]|uniref:Glucodextranase-like C-terminal domain-containing protein n=1 Tax=candidate division TA06 bacterium B3_TA06 TaxID=2012487 RepID=A0A532VAQ0_UNCT6|nr:MAG: hypothetical protein CEE36_00625 [candidate division TA06 bacterium B3_TA06]
MKRTPLILAVLLILTVLLPGCRERIVYTGPGDWLLLADDPDDGAVGYNAHYLYVDADFSDGVLEFKVETYAPIPDAYDDVILTIYFDTDQDASTGLSTSTPDWGAEAVPNNIGADFMMLAGAEFAEGDRINEDEIYAWDGNVNGWSETPAGSVQDPYRPANTDSVKGTISLDILGNPTGQIDVVAILLCDPDGEAYYDHIPDQNEGHVTIDLESGSATQAFSQAAGVAVDGGSDRRVSLITGKELIEEAR